MATPAFPLPTRALAIDLDGTMLDTVEDLAVAVNLMLADVGMPRVEHARIRTFVGKGLPTLVRRSLAASARTENADEAVFERAMPVFEAHYEAVNGRTTEIYPGVREGLDAIAAAGFPMACITNKATRFTEPLLERVGFARYFGLVLCGDSLPRKKPDPLPLLHAAKHFDVAPGDMLMVGDSLNDAQAARAAGCPVVCVSYGYNEGADVRTLDVDAIVSSLVEVAGMVTRI